jgi:hypothetical protein
MEQLNLFPPKPSQPMLPGMFLFYFDLKMEGMRQAINERMGLWYLGEDEPEIDFRHMEVSIPLRPWQLSFDSKFMHYLENRVARGMDDFTLHLARLIYGQEE